MACCSQNRAAIEPARPIQSGCCAQQSPVAVSCCGDAKPDSGPSEEVLLTLEGLHCIACVNKVEKILGTQLGVWEARVNLTKKQARLTVQSGRFVLSDALEALSRAGFNGRRLSDKQIEQQTRDSKEQRAMLLKLGVA
ncbi:MAG: cation transporter, partial [Candidatus Eremiobacteraeota bacterium]|nr:cation transporter [Candidatus Eremiobacteraeota bacterium]